MILEACIETLDGALAAELNGAHRLEFCGDLSVGGITPDETILRSVLAQSKLPTKVMVRPRGGNFVYSEMEIERMKIEIKKLKDMGVTDIVTGVLTTDNQLDVSKIEELASIAFPLNLTIHKCIDETADPVQAIHSIKHIKNINAVLSSGGQGTALQGMEKLKRMLIACGNQIELVAAGSITTKNRMEVHHQLKAKAYHGRKIVNGLG